MNILRDYVAEKVAQISAGPKNAVAGYANHARGACDIQAWRTPDAEEAIQALRHWIEAAERERLYRNGTGAVGGLRRVVQDSRVEAERQVRDYDPFL